jgi:hypothetical protein
VLNILVPQVELNCSRVLAGVRQVGPRRVPEHVRMNWELDVSRLARRRDYEMDRANRQRTTTQRRKHVGRHLVLLPFPRAQRPPRGSSERMS